MKISKETINSIPNLIKEKKLTYQEALDILSVELLKNPKFFLGEIPDEEIKSELILRILQKGNFVLERYKEGYGIFSAYFTSFVKFQYLTLKRQKKSQMISEATYVIIQKTDYEAQLELYENQEYFKNKVSYEPYSLSEKSNFISKNNKKSLLEKIYKSNNKFKTEDKPIYFNNIEDLSNYKLRDSFHGIYKSGNVTINAASTLGYKSKRRPQQDDE